MGANTNHDKICGKITSSFEFSIEIIATKEQILHMVCMFSWIYALNFYGKALLFSKLETS